jgi:hypothetical protein
MNLLMEGRLIKTMRNIWSLSAKPGEASANWRLRAQLIQQNDDGRVPRHVVHRAVPAERADLARRPELIAALAARGFTVEDSVTDNGVILNHVSAVSGSGFDALTTELAAWFAAQDWRYDGWECKTVSRGAAKPRDGHTY